MKIIDKTPLLNEKGELRLPQRIQGMLKYGFDWPTELEAQKAIVSYFDRQLEKGYTLIRNVALGASGIVVPLILLGPTGIYVINVTYLRGRYEARGNAWNEEAGDSYKPAAVNLIQITARMARAVNAFIVRQGINVPIKIEPVLISANPGMHIDFFNPAIKVMMIDGIKSFVSGLSSAAPVLRVEAVHEFTERIVNPRSPKKDSAPVLATQVSATAEEKTQPPQNVSRARAIFDAAEEAKPFDPADFDFAMSNDEGALEALTPPAGESNSETPLPPPASPAKRVMGLTLPQLGVIAALAIALLCILAVFAIILLNPSLISL
jgi:nuclease-like protein